MNPSRVADAAVPGVVRLEWTGPQGNRRYVKRRNPVYLRHGLGRWADAVPLSWDTGRAAPAARETDAPAKQ